MSSDEKLQLVAFSTNDTTDTPNEIINIFLSKHTHSILKQSKHAYAFQTELPGTNKQTKIMIYSILDLQKEYPGIKDVNCYIMFIDTEKEESTQLFNDMIVYFREYCNTTKKIYVVALETNDFSNPVLNKSDICGKFDENQLTYEYNTMNLDDNNSIEEIFLKILDYSLKNPIKSASNTSQQEQVVDKSCNIF